MNIDLTQIILAVITLVGTVLTGFIIPLIRSKIDENHQAAFDSAVKIAVYAAEQIYTASKSGPEKKAYVIQLLEDQGYVVDNAAVDAAIEAQVQALRNLKNDEK